MRGLLNLLFIFGAVLEILLAASTGRSLQWQIIIYSPFRDKVLLIGHEFIICAEHAIYYKVFHLSL